MISQVVIKRKIFFIKVTERIGL